MNTKKISGAYILEIFVRNEFSMSIGRLGVVTFPKGYYYYVGSALSSRLFSRIVRHCRSCDKKRRHWHIDYLLCSSESLLTRIFVFPSHFRDECYVSRFLSSLCSFSVRGFGSTDCNCSSHLHYRKEPLLL